MKLGLLITATLLAAFPPRALAAPATAEAAPPRLYAVTSWGDLVACYGPGTDPAMDTPQALENMIRFWKGRGYAGVCMRTDLGQIEPLIRRNPISATTQASQSTGNSDPRLAWLYKYIDRVMAQYDFHATGELLSEKLGFEWWAWHPHLYSDGAPETAGYAGPGHIWPWTYCAKYTYEHPEVITVDRKGHPYWMVREYAYPGARQSKVDEFVYMAKTFGLKRFVACMRSEASQIQDPPDKADRYGFNKPVVEDMQRIYGVDILTDPRFDVDSPKFDPTNAIVQKWHDLRGSYVTQFYRELRKALRDVDPQIKLAVTLSGDYVGPPLGNWRLDWRTWVDEGLIDQIITPVFFEATVDNDASKKGYLTNVREGGGVISHQAIRDYIAHSGHPEIQVIATSAPPYIFSAPPPGADGWRIDGWYSLYHLAWYQRWWKQCVKDVEDNGYIRFIRQNFDDFPVGSNGMAGGWGDARYDPTHHACPGAWYTLGDGSDARPAATKDTVHGGSGQSIRLTAWLARKASLIGFHRSYPDRSGIYSGVDNAITNGSATFEFWVYRDSEESGLYAYLQDTDTDRDVALKIAPETGKVSYSTSRAGQPGLWVETDAAVASRQWRRLAIVANLDQRTYDGFAGEGPQAARLWHDIPIDQPKPRVIEHPNDPTPIAVPSWKMFRQVKFVPGGKPGSTIYVDDVAVNWVPTLHYARPRPKVFFQDDFERHAAAAPINNARTSRGGIWQTASESAGTAAFAVTSDTSFGEGVKALCATAGGAAIARGEPLRHIPNSLITVDLDLFIRSDKDYPYIMPDPTTTSTHRAMVGLRRKGPPGDHAAVALASRGTWWLWDGSRFADTGVRVAYDAWNHLQIAVDAPSGTYRLVVQPVGQMPALAGTAKLGEAIVINSDLEFFIETSDTENHLSLYDNVLVTAGARP